MARAPARIALAAFLAGVLLLTPGCAWFVAGGAAALVLLLQDDEEPGAPAPATPPVVVLAASDRMVSSPGSVDFTLIDAQGDAVSILVEYRVGSGAFHAATEGAGGDGVTDLTASPAGESHVFSWDFSSGPDLTAPETLDVTVRITATDATGLSSQDESTGHALGNAPPVVESVTVPAGDVTGTATVTFVLSDSFGDVADVEVEFKREEDGADWAAFGQPAASEVASAASSLATSPAPGTEHFFPWDSDAPSDMQGEDGDVRVRVRATDALGASGAWMESAALLRIRNSTAPWITIASLPVQQSGMIVIPYSCTDLEGHTVSVAAEFREIGAGDWKAATGGPGTTAARFAATPAGTPGVFVWDTVRDRVHQKDVTFRLTPSEENLLGSAATRDFSVGNDGAAAWVFKSALPTPRRSLGAAALDGVIYAVGGYTQGTATYHATVEAYDSITDAWSSRAPLPVQREALCCAAFGGRVYAIGGWLNTTWAASQVYAYDPAADAWTQVASMPTARSAAACAVAGGRIYVVGGFDGSTRLATAEAYDPGGDTWTVLPSLSQGRMGIGCAAVNGIVYAVSGSNAPNAYSTLVERFDPALNNWAPVAPIPAGRMNFGCADAGGRIYATGGWYGPMAAVEVYDPAANAWSSSLALPESRYGHEAVESEGKLYVVGGGNTAAEFSSLLQFETAARGWSYRANLPVARSSHGMAVSQGRVYAVGGWIGVRTNTVAAYDPATDAWTAAPPMALGRSGLACAAYQGKIFAMGGYASTQTAAVEVFDPLTGIWSPRASMPAPQTLDGAGVADGKIYVVSGSGGWTVLYAYDPATDSWAVKPNLAGTRYGPGAACWNGKVYVLGGADPMGMPNPVWYDQAAVFDPGTDTWTIAANRSAFRRQDHVCVPFEDRILLLGGQLDSGLYSSVVEEYDPASDGWTVKAAFGTGRSSFGAAELYGNLYLAGGYLNTVGYLASTEVYTVRPGTPVLRSLGTLDAARAGGVLAFDGGTVLAAGGADGAATALASAAAADIAADLPAAGPFSLHPEFAPRAAMATPRRDAAAACWNGRIYVSGGIGTGGTLATLESYDPPADTWTPLPNAMAVARSGHGTAVVGARLFLVGGDTGSGVTASVEVFNLSTGSWEAGPFAPLAVARARFGCGVEPQSGRIYVFGGENGSGTLLASAERYDPATDAWTTLGAMPLAIRRTLCLLEGPNLCLFGGEIPHPTAGAAPTSRIWIYEHTADLWRESDRGLPAPARDLLGCTASVTWSQRGSAQTDQFCLLGGGTDGTNALDGFFRFYRR